jgi:2-polyprenyl-3-methyl-5-hydroxy-6-metoxy-1,4-benzoquinol methylase
MSDFRVKLYERYVSSFKGRQSEQSQAELARYWQWCQAKYQPIIQALPRDSVVLDLGCGAGAMMQFLVNMGFQQVQGIDISEEQIQIAQRQGLNAQVADAWAYLEANANAFDLIVAFDFFEHFTRDELLEITPLIWRALRPDGRLLLQTPNGSGLFPGQVMYGDLTHMTIFTPESMTNLLRLTQFADIQFYETGPAAIDTKGRIRLALWRLIRLGVNTIRLIETGKRLEIVTENFICYCRKA